MSKKITIDITKPLELIAAGKHNEVEDILAREIVQYLQDGTANWHVLMNYSALVYVMGERVREQFVPSKLHAYVQKFIEELLYQPNLSMSYNRAQIVDLFSSELASDHQLAYRELCIAAILNS